MVNDGRSPVKHPLEHDRAVRGSPLECRITRMYGIAVLAQASAAAKTTNPHGRDGGHEGSHWSSPAAPASRGGRSFVESRDGCLSTKWEPAPTGETSYVDELLRDRPLG